MSPTGIGAWKDQRGSLISREFSDLSPLGPGPFSIKSGQVAPLPYGGGSISYGGGGIPNGGPHTPSSIEYRLSGPFDRNPRTVSRNVGGNEPHNPQVDLDAANLSNMWMKMLSGEGGHLREVR